MAKNLKNVMAFEELTENEQAAISGGTTTYVDWYLITLPNLNLNNDYTAPGRNAWWSYTENWVWVRMNGSKIVEAYTVGPR